MRPVHAALCDVCEDCASKGRRQSAETLLGYSTPGGEDSAIGSMLRALALYADCHLKNYGSAIGEDYILGESWEKALRAVRELLNGETGRLDCGDTDRAILAMHAAAGLEGEL